MPVLGRTMKISRGKLEAAFRSIKKARAPDPGEMYVKVQTSFKNKIKNQF